MRHPYLWSVESLAGWEADEPGNSHLPPEESQGYGEVGDVQSPLRGTFIRMWEERRRASWHGWESAPRPPRVAEMSPLPSEGIVK